MAQLYSGDVLPRGDDDFQVSADGEELQHTWSMQYDRYDANTTLGSSSSSSSHEEPQKSLEKSQSHTLRTTLQQPQQYLQLVIDGDLPNVAKEVLCRGEGKGLVSSSHR